MIKPFLFSYIFVSYLGIYLYVVIVHLPVGLWTYYTVRSLLPQHNFLLQVLHLWKRVCLCIIKHMSFLYFKKKIIVKLFRYIMPSDLYIFTVILKLPNDTIHHISGFFSCNFWDADSHSGPLHWPQDGPKIVERPA